MSELEASADESPKEIWLHAEGTYWFIDPDTGTRIQRTWDNVFRNCRIPMTYLDDEELDQCLLRRAITGKLNTRADRKNRLAISPQAARARKAEMLRRAMHENDAFIDRGFRTLRDIADDDTQDAQHRIRAIAEVFDRMGVIKQQKIEVSAEVAVWEQGIGGLLVEVTEPAMIEPVAGEGN